MRIPASIVIRGRTYAVRIVRMKKDTAGEAKQKDRVIRIQRGMDRDLQEETFLHEILHLVDWRMKEKQVNKIARDLYKVITENKLWR